MEKTVQLQTVYTIKYIQYDSILYACYIQQISKKFQYKYIQICTFFNICIYMYSSNVYLYLFLYIIQKIYNYIIYCGVVVNQYKCINFLVYIYVHYWIYKDFFTNLVSGCTVYQTFFNPHDQKIILGLLFPIFQSMLYTIWGNNQIQQNFNHDDQFQLRQLSQFYETDIYEKILFKTRLFQKFNHKAPYFTYFLVGMKLV
eukprot:TRINITY_DN2374_c0_g1_i9.p8 TRINITY_DN2374_c0_g1~~TRINITY_DN2374_c0_g1_i9.p8  ORF type:complete len:200 (+),score=-15.12 TRINITY_DN2374_c0_g1_i9:903-1502(+)